MSNSEGKCSVHGSFMVPFCLGDPPKVLLLLSDGQTADRHIVFRPLKIIWNGNRFTPTNLTKYVYLPNPTLWPSNIVYNVSAEIVLAPTDTSKTSPSPASKLHTYLLQGVASPLNTVSYPLRTVLSDPSKEHELWLVFQYITGASNGGYSVLGKPIFPSKSSARDVLTTSRRLEVPSSYSESDPHPSVSVSKIIEALENNFCSSDDTSQEDSSSYRSGSIYSPTGDTSSCSDDFTRVDDKEELDDVLATLKTLSFHSPEKSSTRYSSVCGSDSETAGEWRRRKR